MVTMASSSGTRKARLAVASDRKFSLVLNGLCEHRPAEEVCQEANIPVALYRQWQQQITQADTAGALENRIAQLEAENANLLRQVRIYRGLCIED
jgi:Transposase